ncbi:MAG: stage II sporulation protein M [Candidatus Woesearchaeota archaeon]
MVLEQLFHLHWIEKHENAFLLGLIFTFVGYLSAKLIFGASIDLMSIAFVSLLLLPSLNKLLSMEELAEIREKKFSFIQLCKDHKDLLKVYTFLFLGIFMGFAFIGLFTPQDAMFREFSTQFTTAGIQPGYQYNPDINKWETFALQDFDPTKERFQQSFKRIVGNNLIVFIACILLSIAYGAGAILFLTWNASVWGIVFVYFVKVASVSVGQNPFIYFWVLFIPFLPHMILEGISYILAAIAGGVVSKALIKEKLFTPQFNHVITDALIIMIIGLLVVILAGYIEVGMYLA